MAYISNPNEISFNGESLRGFVIEEINDEKIEINGKAFKSVRREK